MLFKVECFVLYVGGGVVVCDVLVKVIELVEKFNVLVICMLMGFGVMLGIYK